MVSNLARNKIVRVCEKEERVWERVTESESAKEWNGRRDKGLFPSFNQPLWRRDSPRFEQVRTPFKKNLNPHLPLFAFNQIASHQIWNEIDGEKGRDRVRRRNKRKKYWEEKVRRGKDREERVCWSQQWRDLLRCKVYETSTLRDRKRENRREGERRVEDKWWQGSWMDQSWS